MTGTRAVLCSLGVVFVVSAGCTTTVTTADGAAPVPKPTEPSPPPKSARPNALAVTFAPKPSDSNGNLLPDTLQQRVEIGLLNSGTYKMESSFAI